MEDWEWWFMLDNWVCMELVLDMFVDDIVLNGLEDFLEEIDVD